MRAFIIAAVLAGLAGVLVALVGTERLLPGMCHLDPPQGMSLLVVTASGERWDVVPDVAFQREGSIARASYARVEVPPGGPLQVVVASERNLVVELAGDVARIAHLRVLHSTGFDIAVTGLAPDKISFLTSEICGERAVGTSGSETVRTVRLAWPRDPPQEIPCEAFECFTTPIRWPRRIELPTVIDIDRATAVSSGALTKPDLLPGRAGLTQLVQRGLLRRPEPGEAEAALEKVRAKYVSRFSPDWRPQFGIDFVMTAPTDLPGSDHASGSAFRAVTVLAPAGVTVTQSGWNCIVAMGPVAAQNDLDGALSKLRQTPPYVIAGSNQRCLGDDWNLYSSLFQVADEISPVSVPECRAVEVDANARVIALYDYRDRHGPPPNEERLIQLRLQGERPVVLVGITASIYRRWRLEEAYPGQVSAFVLAESHGRRDPVVRVEGLRPDQVIVNAARLSEWRTAGDPEALRPWRTARLDDCGGRVRRVNWHPHGSSASISERAFDLNVEIWTGRRIDVLKYVDSPEVIELQTD